MTIYVDDAAIPATVSNNGRPLTSRWSHMMADTVPELDAFATRVLNLRPEWRQDKPSGVHYDLTAAKTALALRKGAVLVPTRSPEWLRVHELARAQWWQVCPLAQWREARCAWREINYTRLFSPLEIESRTAEAQCRRLFGERSHLG